MTGKDRAGRNADDEAGPEGTSKRRAISRRSILKGGAVAGVAVQSVGILSDIAGAAVNAVSTENALAGSPASEWESTRDDRIVGYTPDFTVLPGATVRFKVKTASTNFRIRVYRLGWYAGNGARRVADLVPSVSLPQNQPAPVVNSATLLVDCGNWATTATWTVPTNAASGVYYAKFERLDASGQSNHTLFVVRSNAASDILVQTSDATWHAYNRYGGASLYWGTNTAPFNSSRSYKVSYNRPIEPDEQENDFFSTEYSLVRFLERNGYNVSYGTCLDTHARPASLLNKKVFISSGHDEYWSGAMRANVTAARNAGVHLMFLTGNEVFWRTRYEPSIDGSGVADRTLVCYKETLDNAKIDPSSEWTGTWRDSRFTTAPNGALPENELTGQLFRCINPVGAPDFPLEVPAEYAKLRIWRNTSIAALLPGQKAVLSASTLGYEWDEAVDNPVRPKGLVKLSQTTATANQVLVDSGSTYVTKSITHNLTLYKAPSGAWVFGAGTVQWAYGLDSYHLSDDGAPTDQRIQQATVNLLADMGAQPSTLMSGLLSASRTTDTLPPVASITGPAANASFPVGSPVTVTGTAVDSGGGQVAGVEVSTDGGTSWHPANGTESWSYVFTPLVLGPMTIQVRAIDDSLNLQATPTTRTVQSVQRTLPCPLFASSLVPTNTSTDDPGAIEVGMKVRATIDGFIAGVRFYKGANNTGTHVGNVWSSTGALLATGTFSNETASGWQTVNVTPVAVTAGSTYVVSVFMPNGHYASDQGFFNSPYDLWPLSGLANGTDGPNGVYRYGSAGFPTSSYAATNYWVDLVLSNSDNRKPTVIDTSPGKGLQSVVQSTRVSATFSESMTANSIVFQLTGPANAVIAGTTSYDPATRTVSFLPTAPLAALTQYAATVVTAKDSSGDAMAAPFSWTFTTTGVPGTSPTSLWDTSAVPATLATETSPLELGTRFRSSVTGQVTALRFYKAPGSVGPHVGHLWDSTGTLLATATYAAETASGWQQVNLINPVNVVKNLDYVVSYSCPGGVYGASSGYFNTNSDRGPLRAPATDPSAPNGLFRYGPSAFPNGTWQATNYWADVVFSGVATALAPTVTNLEPAPNLVAVATAGPVRARFDKAIDPAQLTFQLRTPAGTVVPATVTYDAPSLTATLTPNNALSENTVYSASVTAKDTAGNAMSAPRTWTFTTQAAAGTTPATLWSTAVIPATVTAADTSAVELGLRLRPERDGIITAIRFFKGATNTGSHVGHLWSQDGTLLGSAAFADETASGWQQANLTSPVPVTAGTTYVASYFAPAGGYSVSPGFFNSPTTASPLSAPASAAGAGNGLFVYGSGGFPTGSFGSSNYWVDVVFVDSAAPAVVGSIPAGGALGVPLNSGVAVVFSEDVRPASVAVQLRDSGGGLVSGSVSYDSATRTAVFTPSAALSAGSTYTVSASATDLQGNAMAAPSSWSFTTVAAAVITLWPDSAVPALPSAGDTSSVEVGLKFRSDVAGKVHGVRFYKGPGNTGSHLGHLWTSAGQLLGTATFSSETSSGWQSGSFPAPVQIQPGTTYVVSYLAPNGNYSASGAFFGTETVNGPLHALADGAGGGNGVYGYGAGGFPTSSWNATNYWVDLQFRAD